MRLVFMGTPEFAVPALDALHGAGHEIAAVYTQPPRPAGRGKRARPSPVEARAETLGLEVRHPASLKPQEEKDAFAAIGAEAAVVAAYGLILPRAILDAPEHGCLNIHASLLPRWRGAAPIHRAIMAGDAETGVCIMQMEPGLDTGPVLLRRATPIGTDETTGDVQARLAVLGAEAVVAALEGIDALTPIAQGETGVTYAHKIDKSEARIDWSQPADAVARRIRALSPFPGAWCLAGSERLKLHRARAVPGSGAPGERIGPFTVACGDGAVEVTQAQRAGRRPMAAEEILRGMDLPDRLA